MDGMSETRIPFINYSEALYYYTLKTFFCFNHKREVPYFVNIMIISCKNHLSCIKTCSTSLMNFSRDGSWRSQNREAPVKRLCFSYCRRIIEIKSSNELTSLHTGQSFSSKRKKTTVLA